MRLIVNVSTTDAGGGGVGSSLVIQLVDTLSSERFELRLGHIYTSCIKSDDKTSNQGSIWEGRIEKANVSPIALYFL